MTYAIHTPVSQLCTGHLPIKQAARQGEGRGRGDKGSPSASLAWCAMRAACAVRSAWRNDMRNDTPRAMLAACCALAARHVARCAAPGRHALRWLPAAPRYATLSAARRAALAAGCATRCAAPGRGAPPARKRTPTPAKKRPAACVSRGSGPGNRFGSSPLFMGYFPAGFKMKNHCKPIQPLGIDPVGTNTRSQRLNPHIFALMRTTQ